MFRCMGDMPIDVAIAFLYCLRTDAALKQGEEMLALAKAREQQEFEMLKQVSFGRE